MRPAVPPGVPRKACVDEQQVDAEEAERAAAAEERRQRPPIERQPARSSLYERQRRKQHETWMCAAVAAQHDSGPDEPAKDDQRYDAGVK